MYKIANDFCVIRLSDGAAIPRSEGNSDYATYIAWLAEGNTPEPIDPPTQAEVIASYTSALEAHYDEKARERKYDNRLTCTLRAGYAGPFQAEGTAFAIWMDNCNATVYGVLNDVISGLRSAPSITELISSLPVLVWP